MIIYDILYTPEPSVNLMDLIVAFCIVSCLHLCLCFCVATEFSANKDLYINTKYAAEICGNMVQNCLKPTTPSRYTGVRTYGWCHSVGNQMVEVTKPSRNR